MLAFFYSALSNFLFFFPLRVSLFKIWHTMRLFPFFCLFECQRSALFVFFHIKVIINNICTGTRIINFFIFIISRFSLLHRCSYPEDAIKIKSMHWTYSYTERHSHFPEQPHTTVSMQLVSSPAQR